jgi:hypothetical protein
LHKEAAAKIGMQAESSSSSSIDLKSDDSAHSSSTDSAASHDSSGKHPKTFELVEELWLSGDNASRKTWLVYDPNVGQSGGFKCKVCSSLHIAPSYIEFDFSYARTTKALGEPTGASTSANKASLDMSRARTTKQPCTLLRHRKWTRQ